MKENSNITPELLEKARQMIILPIDTSIYSQAEKLIAMYASRVGKMKVGLQAMTSIGGPRIVQLLSEHSGEIFYDGKFNDIPNTVGDATTPLSLWPYVKMMNVHATSGYKAIEAAVKNRGHVDVLVVTVLTSISPEECMELFKGTPEETVLKFARKALNHGAQGIICSPKELQMLSEYPDLNALKKVTPGIQPVWVQKNDQERVMTPYEAVLAGADYLVIGRAITNPPLDHELINGDPMNAIKLITEEIATALFEMEGATSR